MVTGLLLLAGCGSDDSASEDETAVAAGEAGTDGTEGGGAVEVTAQEFEFTPDEWTVPSGTFDVTLTNDGEVEHEWAVIALGEDLESADDFSEDKVLMEVEAIDPGTSATQTMTIDEPGTYQVICALEGHFAAGMEGHLTVE
jgi:plastocyanin